MQKTTADKSRGIQWTPFSQLEVLNFADNLAALSIKFCHLQVKTDRLIGFARQTGMNFSASKTKVVVSHLILLFVLITWAALLIRTMQHKRTLKQSLGKLAVHLQDSSLSGSQSNTTSEQR